LAVRFGRRLPPLARLHDERNALQQSAAAYGRELDERGAAAVKLRSELLRLQEQLDACDSDRAMLRRDLSRLQEQLDEVAARRAQGCLIDLDYPYTPKVREWNRSPGGDFCRRLIVAGTDRYRERLASVLAYKSAFAAIACDEPADEREPFWSNPWVPVLDAICLSALVADINPRRYVEVGSGNSTKFVRRAIADHGLRTRIISIDPHPRAVVEDLCDEVIRKGLEDCDLSIFAELGPDDLVFIDNSHRSFQNSDVTVVFSEVLPLLKPGCHYGIHDIFLPNDYPAEWFSRAYNEQYLLMAYLLGGAGGDRIVLPVHYVQQTPELLAILYPIIRDPALQGTPPLGGAFWMVKA
jgi:hypothetical protein